MRFAGHVTIDGQPAAWQRLALVRAEPKPATGLGFVTTDGNGDFGVDLALADGGTFEVRLPDGTGASPPVEVLVEPRIRMAVRARDPATLSSSDSSSMPRMAMMACSAL